MKKEPGFVSVGNAQLYFETAGQEAQLVFLHAGVADSRQWNNEFSSISRDYRVLRYDMRGLEKAYRSRGIHPHRRFGDAHGTSLGRPTDDVDWLLAGWNTGDGFRP